MTENEKAKAYDEALKKASAAHKDEDRHLKATLERIFPELKEDDDEKIKKDLIQWVDEFPDTIWRGHYKNDIIAWLEEQGDKDKLIQELGEYKVKYTQEVLEKYINSMSNKDDERLRKNCIHFLELQKQHHAATFEIEECIDWLEKQGEQKPTLPKWKYKKDNTPLLRDSIILNKYGGVAKSPYGAIVSDAWVLDYDELAKLPKEEKIEPKFKAGDWVIFITSGSIYQVEKIENYEYTLRDIHGGSFCVSFSNEKLIREWNIQDVKDGDVLSFYSEYKGNKMVQVGIIEKYVGKHGGCSNTFKIHVGVNWDNNLQIGRYMGCSDIYPATKEQRDLLSQKIKETGYEWDVDKKELKKLDLVPNKKPILEGLKMKTYNDINIGDTVYIWGTSDSSVDETTITENMMIEVIGTLNLVMDV